jgi:GT2 family glycosyltransferase
MAMASRYLRAFYSAYQDVDLKAICHEQARLADVWPASPKDATEASVLAGNIFSEMFLGNLVHTSTVMLRCERLRKTGLFDTSLRHSGEDYDFHFRATSHGPVALLDFPTIRYRARSTEPSPMDDSCSAQQPCYDYEIFW